MRPINGRFMLPLFCVSVLSFSTAHAAQTDAFLTQMETRQVSPAVKGWNAFWDSLRGKHGAAADLEVTVMDTDGHPLAGATVLAGQSVGVPFQGNQAVTDVNGKVTFAAPALRAGPVSVTASLADYTTASVIDNQGSAVIFSLQHHPDERGTGWVRGHLNNIPKLGGGNLEMGFFIPAARPETLLNFDIQSFVSSYTVKVNVYGDRDIPGNVVLPSQTKYYGIIPISISKPDYVMPLPTSTYAHMYGVAGGISISQAVGLVQKKDFLELVNVVQLTNVGWTRDRVQVHGNENFDINASHTVQPNQVSAQLSGVNGLDAVSVSLLDPSGDKGDYVAMDVKSLKKENMQNGGGTMRLGQIRSRRALDNSYVFTALFDKAQIQNNASRWVVGSVQPVNGRSVIPFAHFLNPIRTSTVAQNNHDYRFSSPAGNGIAPDMVLVNIVSEINNPETMGTTRKVLWSAMVVGSTDHISLPDLGHPVLPPADASKGEKFHWEVTGIRSSARSHSGEVNLQALLRNLQDVSTLVQAY